MSDDTKAPQGLQIPTRKVVLTDPNLIPADYSSTPGGTWYSTTPGGTRIIYDREFLLQCRNSPLSKSSPRDLPNIPGVTSPMADEVHDEKTEDDASVKERKREASKDGEQFDMDL